MKNIIFTLTLLAVMFTGSKIFAGGGDPHDSLLFDGGNTVSPATLCPIMVKYITGFGEATIVHSKIVLICGEPDTVIKYKKGVVKVNDELKAGDEITTGPGAFMQIEFPDGSEIRMGPNSKVVVGKDWCKDYGITDFLGDVWHKVKYQLGKDKYEVKTERAVLGSRHTEYLVSTKIEGSDTIITVKVYDGSVEIKPLRIDNSEMTEVGKQMQQIIKDYADKKISQDEYMKGIQELSAKMSALEKDLPKSIVTVDAGNMCIITKRLGDVVPIPSGDDRWFEINFK